MQKLESTASLYPRAKGNSALQTKYSEGVGEVGAPRRLGFTLNNNLTEALNFQLPDGRTFGDLLAKLHVADRSASNLASRVLYQMMVEADDLRYPWFSLEKSRRDAPPVLTAENLMSPEETALLETIALERRKFVRT